MREAEKSRTMMWKFVADLHIPFLPLPVGLSWRGRSFSKSRGLEKGIRGLVMTQWMHSDEDIVTMMVPFRGQRQGSGPPTLKVQLRDVRCGLGYLCHPIFFANQLLGAFTFFGRIANNIPQPCTCMLPMIVLSPIVLPSAHVFYK